MRFLLWGGLYAIGCVVFVFIHRMIGGLTNVVLAGIVVLALLVSK